MAANHLLIGLACFIVRAGSMPNGVNQRPGMTLLLADGEPLELEINGRSVVAADAWLLAPEIRRRFIRPQPHISITVEPSHCAFARLLHWSRLSPGAAHRFEVAAADRVRLAEVATQQAFDAWLDCLLAYSTPSATSRTQLSPGVPAWPGEELHHRDYGRTDLAVLSPKLSEHPGPLLALVAGQHWHSAPEATALAETTAGFGGDE